MTDDEKLIAAVNIARGGGRLLNAQGTSWYAGTSGLMPPERFWSRRKTRLPRMRRDGPRRRRKNPMASAMGSVKPESDSIETKRKDR